MKKFILTLFVLVFLFLSLPVYAFEVDYLNGTAVVTAERLNVRSGPSKDYEAMGKLVKDTVVQVIGVVEPDWYVIEYGGEEGFVHKDYTVFTPTIQGGEEEVVLEEQNDQKYLILGLVVGIGVTIIMMVFTFFKRDKNEGDGEDEEVDDIPLSSHDDTNMHLGEVTYDTYRIDVNPIYFEKTDVIAQPESVWDLEAEHDFLGVMDYPEKEMKAPDINVRTLDSKLEEATAKIEALQKEVEELKKRT